MKRQESNDQNRVSRAKLERIRNDELKTELTLDDLDFLVSGKRYEAKHVAGVARCLFKKHGLNFDEQFGVAISLVELKQLLERWKFSKVDGSQLFVTYGAEKGPWVILCVKRYQNGVVVFYKDVRGGCIPNEIRDTLERGLGQVTFKVHQNKDNNTESYDGIMTLKNMEIIMKTLIENREMLIEDFDKTLFCSVDDIELVISDLRAIVSNDIIDTCLELAKDIAKNAEFNQKVIEMIDSCVELIDYSIKKEVDSQINGFQVVADESEENPNTLAVVDKQLELKDLSNLPQIKLWAKKVELAIDSSENVDFSCATVEQAAFETELSKFPEEKEKFTRLFKLLGVARNIHLSERDGVLDQISGILGVDHSKMTKLYQFIVPFEQVDVTAPQEDIKPEEVVDPEKIDVIVRRSEEFECQKPLEDTNEVKAIEQVLAELTLDSEVKEAAMPNLAEGEECAGDVNEENAGIKDLESKFGKVKEHYENWKEKKVKDIYNWAKAIKRTLKTEQIFEAVAVMDRANELVTGHILRHPQILAVLNIIGSTQGKLCQIESGEGKTVIVSLLAAIKVLQGKQVDVITSNEVLAEEGVNSRGNFFGVFGISVAHNNPDESYRRGPRKCYTADVVYGSMGSFQFDYLKDSFEGLETRGRRKFDFVILDEVDSLLLDNGGHIAKLAEPFPGFDSLKYVYIKIWHELAKAEEEMVRECEEGLQEKSKELKEKSKGEKEYQEQWVLFSSELFEKQDDKIIARIKKSDPANIDLIPIHLRQFAKDMVNEWIKNAIYAKYSCHENEQYVIRTLENGKEPKIVPVDNQGTGVTLKNTMWSNGLHQFVQLKHNLHLTSETLTSSLISNIGYVKLYNNNLFGLTGTLGSTAEQKLLSQVYNVGYSKVPTFKSKVFEEISGKVVADDQFKKTIVEDVLKLTSKKRSVLIICSTIKEVLSLEKKFKKLQQDGLPKISTYFDEDSCEIVQKEIGVGEIIISTNIAGRGSDFKTSPDLESNGGLHVLVCFLPVNQRVEDQAFGRTSRQGNKGTAQIVMRESELLALGFETGDNLPFTVIKEIRDLREAERLEHIQKVELAEIDFHDRIFGLFSNLYRKAMKAEEEQPSMLYLLKDLKEFWAMWLHKKQKEKVAKANVDDEFAKFKDEARHILGEEKEDTFVGGNVTHNPYYSIQQAEYFLENLLLDRAQTSLEHAFMLSGDFAELLFPAHIKLFELSIEQGQALVEGFLDLIKRKLGIVQTIEANDDYKEDAKAALELAKKGLEKEVEYIELNITNRDSQDPSKIFVRGPEKVLAKHIISKLTLLHMYLEHVNKLSEQIEISITEKTAIALRSKVTGYWNSTKLRPEHQQLRNLICDDELRELSLKGLGTMYSLKTVPLEFEVSLVKYGLIQLGIGSAAFVTGLIFPPAMFIMAQVGEVFIIEGVMDVVIAIVTQGEGKFDWKAKSR